MLFQLFVFQFGQLCEVGILWMQGEDRYAAVGIRVCPCVCDGGVVDGQYLQHALPGERHPVYHLLQVAEVAHSEACLRAQREYRHERSGHSGGINGEVGRWQTVHGHLSPLHLRHLYGAVHAALPYGCEVSDGV